MQIGGYISVLGVPGGRLRLREPGVDAAGKVGGFLAGGKRRQGRHWSTVTRVMILDLPFEQAEVPRKAGMGYIASRMRPSIASIPQ